MTGKTKRLKFTIKKTPGVQIVKKSLYNFQANESFSCSWWAYK